MTILKKRMFMVRFQLFSDLKMSSNLFFVVEGKNGTWTEHGNWATDGASMQTRNMTN